MSGPGSFLKKLFGASPYREAAHTLYAAAVLQARRPGFYEKWGVPDTVEGRFDMIVVHVHALMRALKGQGRSANRLAQALFDIMFDDMDQNMRELGVSDIRIGKRIKELAGSFYGRIGAYDEALASESEANALEDALRRNVYLATPDGDAAALAAYVRRLADEMAAVSVDELLAGRVSFPSDDIQ